MPQARGGPTRRANLWAVCRYCDLLKGDRVAAPDPETGALTPLFNPRAERWPDHFTWIDGGLRIQGTTLTGRATVAALALNRALLVRARSCWVSAAWPYLGNARRYCDR